jgi:hypothetical protein
MKARPKIAVAFVVLGLVALCALGVVFMVGRAFPAWSDGAYGGTKPTSPALVVAFFAAYFALGAAAAFIEKQQARILMLVGAHVAPLLPLPMLKSDDAKSFLVFYVLVYLFSSPLWLKLVRSDPDGSSNTAHE